MNSKNLSSSLLSKNRYNTYIKLPFYLFYTYYYLSYCISQIIFHKEKVYRIPNKIPIKEVSWQFFNTFDLDGKINNNHFSLKIKIENDLENYVDLYYQDIDLGREIRYSQSNLQIDQMDNKIISRDLKLYKIKKTDSILIEVDLPELFLNVEVNFRKENLLNIKKGKNEALIGLLTKDQVITGRILKKYSEERIENVSETDLNFLLIKEFI